MTELTWHTGNQGDSLTLTVAWFDEHLVRQETTVRLAIQDRDRPRTLEIVVNGVTLAEIKPADEGAW